ncbi:MAG: hypothetical protein ACOX2Q_10215 [Dehalobacterium sp.]|jgi:hypothetical protein
MEIQIRDCFTREGHSRKNELNVFVIPSVTVNNMVAFETQIPDEEDLINVMHEFLQELNESPNI